MKQISGIFLVSMALFAVSSSMRAATVEQVLNLSVTGSYVSTKVGPGAVTNNVIKTSAITTATVVKALAYDLNDFTKIGGQLIHIIDPATSAEKIVLRKAGADTDVTTYFGSPVNNFNSTSTTNDYVQTGSLTTVKTNTTSKIVLSDSLNTLSLTTTNLSFVLTNGYGTAFYFSKITKVASVLTTNNWANMNCAGGVDLLVNNVGVWLSSTNSANATNGIGPAHGTFNTTSGTYKP